MGTARVSADGVGLNRPSRLAPGFATTRPGPGQSFRDQDIAEAMAISHEKPEGATVAILVTTRPCSNFEWTLVDQFDQSLGRSVSQSQFRGAFRFADLRCVDVSNPDLRAINLQRITIDDAGDPMAAGAFLKHCRSYIRCGPCHRRGTGREGDGDHDAEHYAAYSEVALPSLFPEEQPGFSGYAKLQMLLFHHARCDDVSRAASIDRLQ